MKIKFTVNLKGATRHDEETGLFVGFCPALRVYSQGRTQQEAMQALESSLCLLVVTCFKQGILDRVLSNAGFTATSTPDSLSTSEACEEFIMIQRAHFDRVFDMSVPLELVAAAALGNNNASSGPRAT